MNTPRLALLLTLAAGLVAADAPGATRIARWKDDKACAFVLMFDDSLPSHVKNVVPELKKHGFTGTFYINPSTGHYAGQRSAWEKDIPAAGMELANHTLTHKGVKSVEDAEREIGGCNEAIHALTPGLPWPRLVSWGQPGVKKEDWTISKDDLQAQFTRHNLVPRPDFGGRGATIALKTAADMTAHVDKAIAAKSMECIIYHGVGGEWLAVPLPVFSEFLDGLAARRDQVWVTGHIPAHQYATERDKATVTVGAVEPARITLTLACKADPKLYDLPLTLVTSVPADWSACSIDQGRRHTDATAAGGQLRYDALPGSEPVVISKR